MAIAKQTKKRSVESLLSEISCNIDDIANGKKGGRVSRHKVISQFIMATLSSNKKAFEEVLAILEADRQKPKIKSLFPDAPPTISEKLRNWPDQKAGLSALLQKATLFSDWHKKSEFLRILDSLGILLEYGKVLGEAFALVKSKTYLSKLVAKNQRGFVYLRELSSVFYTAATMKILPTISATEKISDKDRNDIVMAVKRFSIEKEITEQYKHLVESIKVTVSDLEDYCRDYPKSSVRTKGLAMLRKYCLLFVSST